MTLLPDNATLVGVECVSDCVPEGFWALCATSFAVMLLMTLAIVWIASPRLFCQCCGNLRRGMAEIQSGVRQTLLEARGTAHRPDDDEPVWTQQPQTRREIELVDLQRKRKEDAEREEEDKNKQKDKQMKDQ